ncbi:hypothetical protein ACFL16_00270 [Patescibacteria group bacterium]
MSEDARKAFCGTRKRFGVWAKQVIGNKCSSESCEDFSFCLREYEIDFWKKESSQITSLDFSASAGSCADFGGRISVERGDLEMSVEDIGALKVTKTWKLSGHDEVRVLWKRNELSSVDTLGRIEFIGLKLRDHLMGYVRDGNCLKGYFIGAQSDSIDLNLPSVIEDSIEGCLEVCGINIEEEINFDKEIESIIYESGVEEFCRVMGV